ncbi:MAG: DUF5305 domain-containing protein, partial [Syntrophomonadaceae bacterium]|nr:DUF5305 domain-containing protein [Syntrophomonadaceae bacterium]
MKIYLPRKVRLALIIFSALLLIACGAGLVSKWLTNNEMETEEIPVYQYQQQAVVDYKVNLLPNSFFQEASLSSEQPAYLMSLTDSIDTILNYSFTAQKNLEYEGQYSITGTVKAYARLDKDREVVVWQKDYIYLPDTSFSGNDKIINLTNNVNIPLQSYVQELKQFEETTRFSSSRADIEINYVINLKGSNEHGNIEEKLNPTMVIPLKGSMFMVGGKLKDSQDGAITVTQTKPVENQMEGMAGNIVIGLLGLLMLGIVAIFTVNAPEPTPQEKLLKELFRRHGERIVTLYQMPVTSFDVIKIDNFEDMVKIADEIEKIIFYYQDDSSGC